MPVLFILFILLSAPATAEAPMTVVELFTSQGCSSCPPADALLAELAKRPGILALSYHVDYWDYLGWRDPYGKAAFSELQQRYHDTIESRLYTPQMIINGREVFVGSRQGEAERALRRAGSSKPAVRATVTGQQWQPDRVTLEYELEGGDSKTPVTLALVQKRADNRVPAGENRGRTLTHKNVVRGFAESTGAKGRIGVDKPTDLEKDEVVLILFTRDPETMAITGAIQIGPS